MYEPSSRALRELEARGGPRSALRVVGPGEDPRVVSTDPDQFFRRPHRSLTNAAGAALVALTVLSGYAAVTWLSPPRAPTVVPVTYLVVACLFMLPFWVWWCWRLRRNARVRAGRAACAAAAPEATAQRARAAYVGFGEEPVGRRHLEVSLIADLGTHEVAFAGARFDRGWRPTMLFNSRDPVWVWRSGDWGFGQVAPHGADPTYDPLTDEPRTPTFEELHDGRSPAWYRAELMDLAAQFRAGTVTRDEYDAAVRRLTSP